MMRRDQQNRRYTWIGQSLKRKEDPTLLAGRGRFVDDIVLPRMAHAAVLASPHAHARILRIDTSRAQTLPGVFLVLTGKEAAQMTGPMPTLSPRPVYQHCIALERVRHVGEPVAAVVAVSRYVAEDALALIDVDYEVLPAIVDMEDAIGASGDAILHAELGSNIVLQRRLRWGPVEQDFAGADLIIRREFRWPRVGPQPIETSGAVVNYDPFTNKFTIYSNMSQQGVLAPRIAVTLGVGVNNLNFVNLHVGGSFGGKSSLFHAPILAATLARAAGRPVKYVEDRLEHMANGNQHASDRQYTAELALQRDGTFRSLKLRVIDDYGAYFALSAGSHGNALSQSTGPYRIGSLEYDLTAVLTNKTQQGPYRGFGGEVGNFVLERLVDAAAKELDADPVALRRQNFIRPEQFPYKIPNGNIYDSGDYEAVLDKALQLAELPKWRKLQTEGRAKGRHIGIGIGTVNERSVLSTTELWFLDEKPRFPQTSSPESVQIKINPDGTANVTIYAPHWGNSPETMAAQIVAENLRIPPERIEVTYGDSESGLISKGPVGSRYTVMLAGAVAGASRTLTKKLKRLAAHLLQANVAQLELGDERVYVRDEPGRGLSIAELARHANSFRLSFPADEEFSSGLVAQHIYDHPYTTMPKEDLSDLGAFYPIVGHACHVVVVEVDAETGKVQFLTYVAVHDAGTVVNPAALDGQIRGGIAQGIGTALYEKYHYDESGQLLTASLADYPIPTSQEIPDIIVAHLETPSPFTEFGIKGAGEGGRLAAMPAITAAIDDALSDFGVYVTELPATPSALRALIAQGKRRQTEKPA